MESQGYTSDEGTDCLVAKTQGRVPSSPIPASRSGDIFNQSDFEGLGQLLSSWQLQQVLWIYQRQRGEKDQTTFDACQETPWLRLEQME